MNKSNIRNLYCSVCGNIVPCAKGKKRTVDAFCIYCGKKQKLIDRKSMEPKNQGEFEMPNKNAGNRNYGQNNRNYNHNNKNYGEKRYNNTGYNRNNRGGRRYEDKDE